MSTLTLQEQLSSIKTEMFKSNEIRIEIKHIDNSMDNKSDGELNRNLHSTTLKDAVNKINYNRSFENSERNVYPKEDIKEVVRGGIYYMRLHIDIEGSEQGGRRPVVVIQNDIGNKHSSNIIVVPITSSKIKNPLPTHTKINGYGLTKDSTVLCEMPMTLSKKRIISYVGTIDDITMKFIDRAHKIATSKLQPKSDLERLPQQTQDEINETLQYIYSYEKVLGKSTTGDLNHLVSERAMLLNHLERICRENGLYYRDYYKEYTKERNIAIS